LVFFLKKNAKGYQLATLKESLSFFEEKVYMLATL